MKAREGQCLHQVTLALGAVGRFSGADLHHHNAVETGSRDVLEQVAARLIATSGDQVLVTIAATAVGEVDVRQRITQILAIR